MSEEPTNEPEVVLREQRRKLANGLVRALEEIKQLQNEKEALAEELDTDRATGLRNKRFFANRFGNFVDQAHESKTPMALMLADVDGLKRTNDSLGHGAGDALIDAVAGVLKEIARKDIDVTGRLGGDEFYNIMPGFLPLEGQSMDQLIGATVTRYETAFAEAATRLGLPESIRAGVSFSIAILDVENPQDMAETLFERGDKRLLEIKARKKEASQASGQGYIDDRL